MQNNKGKRLEGRKDVPADAQSEEGTLGGQEGGSTDRGQNAEAMVYLGLCLFCFKIRGKTERREGEKRERENSSPMFLTGLTQPR